MCVKSELEHFEDFVAKTTYSEGRGKKIHVVLTEVQSILTGLYRRHYGEFEVTTLSS